MARYPRTRVLPKKRAIRVDGVDGVFRAYFGS